MSVEGVSNNLDQNSGEIKVRYCEDTMTIDNSDNENSSLVLMGYSAENRSDEEHVNLFCKQIGESIDESAVIFNDIRSVEEWLRNRPDLDCDNIRNDFLYFSSDEISESNEVGRTVSPLETNGNQVIESNVCNLSWDDLVLDSDNGVLRDKNNVFVLGTPNKSVSEYEVSKSEEFTGLSLNPKNVNPPLRLFTENKISSESDPKLQVERVLSESITKEPNVRSSAKSISKSLPFVKIPKNCLMKGKILGKGDISLLSGKSSISFLNGSKTLNIANANTNIANSSNLEVKKKPNILRGRTRTTLLNQSINVANEKSIMVLPVKSVNNISSNFLVSKAHNSRSILKNNSSNKSATLPKLTPANADICGIQNTNTSIQSSMPVALVAISTNKSENTTEIIIKTEDGENVYKGKTSDIMKATGSTIEYKRTNVSEKLRSPSDKQEYDDETINELMVKLFGVSGDTLENFEGAPSQTHLKCPVDGCKYTTSKGSWLKVHVLQHYGIRPFKCDYPDCTWAFYTNFRLKRHQEIHYKKKEYCCPVVDCGRSFSTIYNVNSHLKLHDRPTAVTCQINGCDRAFQTRRSYEKHLQEHGIEYAPYVCLKEGCGKKYFTINSLNSHSRIHQHHEDELRCSYCGKMFDQPCRLKAHINTHIGVKPYKCDFEGCMWAFSTSSKLRRHQRKHTQMRKHVCKVCNKSFLRSEHLKDHSLKHFVKKSFICPISGCATVFANKSSMYAHLKKHRNQELKALETISFPCPMDNCSLTFNTRESLRTHMQLSHVLTGLMNNENSQDTIQLLSDDNLITLDGLQGNAPTSGPGVVSFNSMSQEGLLVGMSDLVQCIPVMEQGDFAESNSSNNIITHVVFTDDLVDEENQELEEMTELTETEARSTSVYHETEARSTSVYHETEARNTSVYHETEARNTSVYHETEARSTSVYHETEARNASVYHETEQNIGSARTGIPYHAGAKDKQPLSLAEIAGGSTGGLHSASDVVLSAGLLVGQDNLERGLLLQDELSGGDLYPSQEESGLLGTAGELQVLLLDSSTREQTSDFEQSTINLRDLE